MGSAKFRNNHPRKGIGLFRGIDRDALTRNDLAIANRPAVRRDGVANFAEELPAIAFLERVFGHAFRLAAQDFAVAFVVARDDRSRGNIQARWEDQIAARWRTRKLYGSTRRSIPSSRANSAQRALWKASLGTRRKEVAPVPRILRREHPAPRLMRARRHRGEDAISEKWLPHFRDQTPAIGMRSGFDPENLASTTGQRQNLAKRRRRQFIQDVAQHEKRIRRQSVH